MDALCDKDGNVTICGIMQHIEQAGVHSGVPLLAYATLKPQPMYMYAARTAGACHLHSAVLLRLIFRILKPQSRGAR